MFLPSCWAVSKSTTWLSQLCLGGDTDRSQPVLNKVAADFHGGCDGGADGANAWSVLCIECLSKYMRGLRLIPLGQ